MKGYEYYLDLVKRKKEILNEIRETYHSIEVLDRDEDLSRQYYLGHIDSLREELAELTKETLRDE